MNSGAPYELPCGSAGLVPGCTGDGELDKGKDQQTSTVSLDTSSFLCSICFELLLDPVVGAQAKSRKFS